MKVATNLVVTVTLNDSWKWANCDGSDCSALLGSVYFSLARSPKIAVNASVKSPVEIPLRYSAGIRASILGTRRM